MSFAEEFQAVERKALVGNTAQDVFNILKDLVNHSSLHASRWIWELLQNARDAAKDVAGWMAVNLDAEVQPGYEMVWDRRVMRETK